MPKCAIVHYRIGKTDGISLEIRKRKKVLRHLGYQVQLISGPKQTGSDHIIPELEFELPKIAKIRHNAFVSFKDYQSESGLKKDIYHISDIIEEKFLEIHQKEKFDIVFLHNIFTHGRHIAAARAFYNIAQNTNIKTIAVNHDFYWVGSYKDIYKPTNSFVKKYLQKYVPPTYPEITHVTINSINQKALLEKKGIKSFIIPDTFDFEQKPWKKDNYNKDFLANFGLKENDVIVLQATRIASRKAIELAIDFVKNLSQQKPKFVNKTLYNGKKITKDSNIIFLLAGYAEKDSWKYKEKIEEKIKKEKIKAKFIHQFVDAKRSRDGRKKIYSLWDCFTFADLVTFPSLWEGWGNQFIETVFAKKPIVVFEYPVFQADIKKEGYKVISLGSKLARKTKEGLVKIKKVKIAKAVDEAISILTSPETSQLLNDNFEIGKKYHSLKVLENHLKNLLKTVIKE